MWVVSGMLSFGWLRWGFRFRGFCNRATAPQVDRCDHTGCILNNKGSLGEGGLVCV